MKNIKRLLVVLILVFSLTLLAGCDFFSSTPESVAKLEVAAAKTTIGVGEKTSISAKIIISDNEEISVPGVIEYETVDTKIVSVSTTGVIEGLSAGEATITVKTVYSDADLLGNIKVTVKDVVSTPTNLIIDSDVLTWTSVKGASNYVVKVNNIEHAVTGTSFSLKDLGLGVGTFEVLVYAKVNDELSLPATTSYVVIDKEAESKIYKALLAFISENYVPDMKLEDFEDEYDYNMYLDDCIMAKAFARGAAQSNVTVEKASKLFEALETTTLDDANSIIEVKEELDKFLDLGFEPYQITTIITELLNDSLEIALEENEERIVDCQKQVTENNARRELILTKQEFADYLNSFNQYATETDRMIVKDYIDGNKPYYFYMGFITDAIYDIEDGKASDALYYAEDNELAIAIINTIIKAYENEDTAFIKKVSDNLFYFEQISFINEISEFIGRDLEYANETKTNLLEVQKLITNNKQAFQTSLNATFTYVINLYDQIDTSIIALFDKAENNTITPEEVILLKNELVAVLKETLPTTKDFENMYLALIVVMNDYLDIEPTDLNGFSNTLAQIEKLSISMMLDVLDEIDLAMYNDINELLDGIFIPGYDVYDSENNYQYNVPATYDAVKVVNLIVYLGDFYNEFTDKYHLQIEALKLLQSITLQDQIDLIFGKIVAKLDVDDEQFTMMGNLYLDYLENRKLYDDVSKIVIKYGEAILDKFIDSDGKIALDYIKIIEDSKGESNLKPFADDYKVIFTQFFDYHDLTFGALTDEEIDTLVDYILHSILLNNNDDEDLTAFVANVTPETKDLVKKVLKIEKDLAAALEANDAAYKFIDLSDVFSLEESLVIQMVKALDVVLTDDNEQLIEEAKKLIFTGIFTEEYFMTSNSITEEDIAITLDKVDAFMVDFYQEISDLASYDFTNLTADQQEAFQSFMEYFGYAN